MTDPKIRCTRRQAMGLMTAAAATPLAASLSNPATAQDATPRKGMFKQSASRWCYDKIPLDEFCLQARNAVQACQDGNGIGPLGGGRNPWRREDRAGRSQKDQQCQQEGKAASAHGIISRWGNDSRPTGCRWRR